MTIRLNGECAKEFARWIEQSKPNPLAIQSYKAGCKLLAEYQVKGYATITGSHDRADYILPEDV